MPLYFLGVDGGQSATKALIGDDAGRVVGHGRAGPCNHVHGAGGREKFTGAIEGSVGEAARRAGLDAATIRFEAACLGFSGGPEDKRVILESMLRCDRLLVTHDAMIALAGATSGAAGIITIAGTGSIAFGRHAQGRVARAGGWGYVFGDEGGGFDITRQALRAALRAEEGWGPPTALRETLLKATGADTANDLLHRFYTSAWTRPRIADLARAVEDTARRGDTTAREILDRAASELAALAGAVRGQLFDPADKVRVAWIGGVFRGEFVRERFRALVPFAGPPDHGPATGALLEAWRAAGLHPVLSNVPEES